MHSNQVINFAAGPTKLPIEVLKKAQEELISYNGIGYSILEMSHRSSHFSKISNDAENLLRDLLEIPNNYKVLFLQGGATGQFSAVPLNLINRNPSRKANYVVTGIWSSKAATEAAKYGTVKEVFPRLKHFTSIPDQSVWNLDPDASYIYYCANETVHGVEFHNLLDIPSDIPVICDMSSNILSKSIPVSRFGMIFASAQKNIGCAGLTIAIIRDDLLCHALPETPTVFNYKFQEGMNSMYNTPPTFSIYIALLMLEWIKEQGGLSEITEINASKAAMMYACIDESDGFYNCPVSVEHRSLVNVVLRIQDNNEQLENEFVSFAKSKYNIMEIKGHRAVGGLRISLYNSIPLEFVEILIQCMKEFQNIQLQKISTN